MKHRTAARAGCGCLPRAGFSLLAGMIITIPAQAVQFGSGDVTGNLDLTLSYGIQSRVSGRDESIIGIANGGTANSVNGDDGNLNYDKGIVSNLVSLIADLELEHRDGYGLFVRGNAFYDFENEDGTREKAPLTPEAKDIVGSDAQILDAYVWGNWNLDEKPVQVRVGDQVLSWGESTFIQNSINTINPVDVARLRVPGSELREALLPVGMVWGSVAPSYTTSVELFYQYDYDEVEIDPPGTYFSTNDFAGDGGDRLFLGFGRVPDTVPFGPNPMFAPVGTVVPRSPDRRPGDSGQYGAALRFFAPALNDTEFGFYYIRYHSRLPIISARTGSLQPTISQSTGLPAGLLAGDYAGSASYFLEYPEDIDLFGASFNTEVGTTGIALQGEISHRLDAPLQVDDVELLFAALSPLAATGSAAGQLFAANNQIGAFGFDQEIPGFIRRDITQVQATATQVFGPRLGADQAIVAAEAAVSYVHDMPEKSDLRLEVPGTYTSGNPVFTLAGAQPVTEDSANFADSTSWGYQVRGRMDFNNAIGPVNLSPQIAWRHDVSGNSPGPGGNFLEGRKAITLGLTASYQNTWEVEFSYTDFFGAGRLNLINDRDFVGLVIKYSR